MIEIPSSIEGGEYHLNDLERLLKPIGYTIGGNWDYDHGYFDYKMDDQEGYQFLRLPFQVVEGQLDSSVCTVKLGRPFLLAHEYEGGVDEEADVGNFSASFDQFQSPENKDAPIPDPFIDTGRVLVSELESIL
ncbi:YugN-like family protein [Robertmurraya massiliosenegalensis]|uniref:YugN-like family protein n=1 Tax=Robertmurraya TaxID=2837507 RepID=UPI0039A565F7